MSRLSGIGKLIAIVVIIVIVAVVGAAIGMSLGGDDDDKTTAKKTTATKPEKKPTAPSEPVRGFKVPRIEVISTKLDPATSATATARIAARLVVTNRRGRALKAEQPKLTIGEHDVALDPKAKDDAGDLLKALDPGKSARGVVRFVVPSSVAQGLDRSTVVRLSIATRTITLKFGARPA